MRSEQRSRRPHAHKSWCTQVRYAHTQNSTHTEQPYCNMKRAYTRRCQSTSENRVIRSTTRQYTRVQCCPLPVARPLSHNDTRSGGSDAPPLPRAHTRKRLRSRAHGLKGGAVGGAACPSSRRPAASLSP